MRNQAEFSTNLFKVLGTLLFPLCYLRRRKSLLDKEIKKFNLPQFETLAAIRVHVRGHICVRLGEAGLATNFSSPELGRKLKNKHLVTKG